MAWFEGISSSLKGQISSLAKGVLADDSDSEKTQESGDPNNSLPRPSSSSGDTRTESSDGWNDGFISPGTFMGQDPNHVSDTSWNNERQNQTPTKHQEQPQEEEETSIISKKLASFLSLGKGSESEVQIATLQEENRTLRIDNEAKAEEIRTYTRIIRDLESVVAVSQDENSNLSTGMEELDIQHQQAIEQVLSVKEETHKQLEALQKSYVELEENLRSLSEEKTKEEQLDKKLLEELENLRQENARLLAEVEKAKKKSDEESYLVNELEDRDRELEDLEGDNANLREELNALRTQLEAESSKNSLPPIPENSEEIDALEHKITSLESDVGVLREVRSNLETEVANSRTVIEDLLMRLQISEGSIRNQENLQIDFDNITSLNNQLESELQKSKRYTETLEADLENLKKEKDNLKEEFVESDKANELLRYESHGKEELLAVENVNLKKKLNQFETAAKHVDKDLERLQNENETTKNKMCEMVFEMNTISEKLKQSEKREGELRVNQKKLELELQSSKDNQKELSLEMTKTDEINNELKNLSTENSKLQQELNERIAEIAAIQDKAKDDGENFILIQSSLEKEVDALKNISHEFEIFKDIQKQRESEFKRQLESKNDEIHRLKNNLEEKEFNWNEQLSATVVDLEFKVTQNETELSRLKKVEADSSEFEKSVNLELNTLKDSLQKSKDEYNKLKEESEAKDKLALEEISIKYANREKQIVQTLSEKIAEQDSNFEILSKNCEESNLELKVLKGKYKTAEESLASQVADNKELLKRIQIKEMVATGLASEIEQINTTLKVEKEKNDKLISENTQLSNNLKDIETRLLEKEGYLEQIEGSKSKEVTVLKQEVESLKNQLEYATQLMHVAERQEAEGRGVTPPPTQNVCTSECSETQKELNRVTTALLKEQTDSKLLVNQVVELKETNSKLNTQLTRLQSHLVEMEEHYTMTEIASRDRITELETKQAKVDDWVKTSSTAYTSANIRANQQVESLTQQVRLLTEHKEKLEAELSRAEDNAQKRLAAETNLQAVLHQIQRDKQRDIEFETERIKQTLNLSYKKHDELKGEIKELQEQLIETKKGLAAANRLSDQLDQKCEQNSTLKTEVGELEKKLKAAEDKLKNVNSNFEGKVDRNLIKNLLVGYVSSGPKFKEQALRVISQVLDLNKDERQRVGLESDGNSNAQQQSLSEAFIRFLESESQPKPQVLLPLSQPPSTTPSRKTSQTSSAGSLLLDEAQLNLPHFTVGRNTGSILKDVLKDRNT